MIDDIVRMMKVTLAERLGDSVLRARAKVQDSCALIGWRGKCDKVAEGTAEMKDR